MVLLSAAAPYRVRILAADDLEQLAEVALETPAVPFDEHRVEALADDLDARRYPDVARCGLLSLVRDGRSYGVGPHHETLRSLGLAHFSEPHPICSYVTATPTELGLAVAGELRRRDEQAALDSLATLADLARIRQASGYSRAELSEAVRTTTIACIWCGSSAGTTTDHDMGDGYERCVSCWGS